jgi:hypothetical protein
MAVKPGLIIGVRVLHYIVLWLFYRYVLYRSSDSPDCNFLLFYRYVLYHSCDSPDCNFLLFYRCVLYRSCDSSDCNFLIGLVYGA